MHSGEIHTERGTHAKGSAEENSSTEESPSSTVKEASRRLEAEKPNATPQGVKRHSEFLVFIQGFKVIGAYP